MVDEGEELKGVKGSLQGGLNAAIEYIDHHHGKDHSLIAGPFGNRAIMKKKAFDLAVRHLRNKLLPTQLGSGTFLASATPLTAATERRGAHTNTRSWLFCRSSHHDL